MNVTIIDYKAGNVRSVLFALERLGVQASLSADPEQIRAADKVIFPGVGEADSTMQYLRQHGLDGVIRDLRQPVLGICLGMQLLCERSEEGDTACLGLIPQQVRRLPAASENLKVPHMGWNALSLGSESWLPAELAGTQVYFVHSYYVEQGRYTSASATHGISFSAALRKDNFFATQFHPEKSGAVGSLILQAFLEQKS